MIILNEKMNKTTLQVEIRRLNAFRDQLRAELTRFEQFRTNNYILSQLQNHRETILKIPNEFKCV